VPWLSPDGGGFWQFATHLTLVHNLWRETFDGLNWVLWSLGVEWQFYLLFPLLLWGRSRIGLPACLGVSLALNVVCQLYLSLHFPWPPIPVSFEWSFPLVTWCDWILGACLAEAFFEQRPLFPRNTLFLLGSLLLLAVALRFKPLEVQSYLISSVFFAAAMDRYLVWNGPLLWFERMLIPVGLISYSLYLWHQVVIRLAVLLGTELGVPRTLGFEVMVYLPLICLVTVAVSVASYRWVEKGVPRLIRQRQPAPKQAAA
jgi:peptidoglycan/LPS O-acetylase OafA/YrhL